MRRSRGRIAQPSSPKGFAEPGSAKRMAFDAGSKAEGGTGETEKGAINVKGRNVLRCPEQYLT